MSREIKFRAWDVNENMTYFSLDPKTMLKGVPTALKNILMQEEGYELMGFTGLEDKNGKEIYEGDIVKVHGSYLFANQPFDSNFTLHKIVWDNDYSGYAMHSIDFMREGGKPAVNQLNINWIKDSNIEVVGNVHERGLA